MLERRIAFRIFSFSSKLEPEAGTSKRLRRRNTEDNEGTDLWMGLHVEEAYDLGGGDAAPEGLPYRLPRYHRHTQGGKPT